VKGAWGLWYALCNSSILLLCSYHVHRIINVYYIPTYAQISSVNLYNKGVKMNIWESLFIHILQKLNLLTEEQKVNDPNPLYELAQDVALHN
jgi:hypothetical protein